MSGLKEIFDREVEKNQSNKHEISQFENVEDSFGYLINHEDLYKIIIKESLNHLNLLSPYYFLSAVFSNF